MATSKEDKDEDIIFEGVKKLVKKTGKLSISVKRKEKRPNLNGVARANPSTVQYSSDDEVDDEDEDEEEEELNYDPPIRMPKYKKKEPQKTQREIEKEEFFTKFQLQRRDDPRALLTHETLCNLSEAVGTLNEERDPDHPTTSVNGVVMPDPFHALQAMDHNLWVLASAASLRLNEVTGRCLLLPNGGDEEGEYGERVDGSEEVEGKKGKRAGNGERKGKPSALMEMLPKALAALSGQQIGFKEKEPEKPKGKGRAPAAAAATKPVTRERPVREKPEPKKKPPPQPKVAAKTKTAQTRSNTALIEKAEAASAESKNGKGPKTRASKEEEAPPPVTANTRKRKAAKDKEEEEEEKTDTKVSAKKGGNTVKRTSQRTAKKAKEDEPLYCHCNRISFGEMVGCDNETCAIEWFHFECINIKSKPKGKWYCPDCRAEPNNSKQPKKPSK